MAVYAQVSVTGAATAASTASPWVPLDIKRSPFAVVSVGVILAPGQGHMDARVQYTYDNVLDSTVSANVYTSTVSAQTTAVNRNIDGSFTAPIAAVRVSIASASGTAGQQIATMTVIQGG